MGKKLLNLLFVVTMLAVLAPMTLAAPPVQGGGQDYVVVADDWLSKLADKYLGNPLAYPAIVYYTNQKNVEDASYAKITNPDLIEVGWKIYIPSVEEAAAYTPATAPVKMGGTLVWANTPDPDTLDPHGTVSSWVANQYYNLYDMLVWRGPEQKIYAGLAKDWEVSGDGKTYTFYLRDDVTFHDGTPFNAEAVKFNFDRIEAETAVRAAGRAAAHDLIGPYESTKVIDEFTVAVHFSEAYPAFLDAVSSHFLSIVSPAAVEKWGDEFMNHPVGTGPFMFEEFVPGERLTLVRNPDYNWAPPFMDHQGPAYLDKVVHLFIDEDTTRAAVLENGEAQLISRPSADDAMRFNTDPKYVLLTGSAPGLPHVLLPNASKYPTNDIRVRQALIYGKDQELLVQTLWPGYHVPAYGPLTSASAGYNPAVKNMYGYDLEKAKSLLEEAGWTVGPDGIRVDKDGNRLHMLVQALIRTDLQDTYEFLQAQYKDLGVEIEISAMETAATNDACTAGTPEICPLYFSFTDPGGLRIMFDSKNAGTGFNWGQVKDPKVDQLLADGLKEVNEKKRMEIYGDLQDYLMEQAYVVPLNEWRSGHVHSKSIEGVRVSYKDSKYFYVYDAHYVK